jgi:hypothetical protein
VRHCFGVGLTAAAGWLVLGGEEALPAGECAPDASIGLSCGGVKANGPGSAQAGPAGAGGNCLPAAVALARYLAATLSCDWQSW